MRKIEMTCEVSTDSIALEDRPVMAPVSSERPPTIAANGISPTAMTLEAVQAEVTRIRSIAADDEMANSNARLIAAAPDLLTACKKAFQFLIQHGNPFAGDDVEIGRELFHAIAKATESKGAADDGPV